MKKRILIILTFLFLSACVPNFGQEDEEVVQETNDAEERALIPYNVSDDYYRMILPYKEGQARGLISRTVNNRLDIDEIESGLMRIAQDNFSTEEYYFQEGQFLSEEIILGWLRREEADGESEGLNPAPSSEEEEDLPEQNRQTPRYLSHVLEHNYLVKNDEGKLEIGGVVIGLSLNTMHYYSVPDYGWPREIELDPEQVEAKGKEYAQEIINRLRAMEHLKEIPIVVALFKEKPRKSIVPGNYFMKTTVASDSSSIKKWEPINEEYVLFPSDYASDNYFNDATKVLNFKSDIDDYFSNYIGVIGNGFYKNGQLQELSIEIPIQFFGKAEIIGFTEFVAGKILDHFPPYITIEVEISSLDRPESLIVRKANSEEPIVHIYQ
jgi:protein involved in sex pheromone biosynthesis